MSESMAQLRSRAAAGHVNMAALKRIIAGFILVTVIVTPVVNAARTCGSKGPYVGFTGPLSMLEHDVGGNVEILDDCTARVTMASYDGAAPAAYWWCAASAGRKDLRAGFRANDKQLTTALNGLQTVTVQLDGTYEWSDCPVLGVWCEMFSADFGHVELKAANGTAVAPAPGKNRTATAPTMLPAGMVDSLDNCLELIPGKLNVYWKLDKPTAPTSVTMTLQGVLTDGSWMAFGFSDPTKPEANMIGGDVVVAGLVQGKGFAVDYYLTKRDQCNYAGSQDAGVCPDAGYKKNASDNNAKMTAFTSIAGVVSVTFTRALVTGSPYDHPWPAGKDATPALYAMGPLSEQSTPQQQVVLYHGLARSEPSFRMTLGASGNKCPTPLTGGAPVNKTQGGQVETMFGRTTFDVTTGPNLNYPNPPAWGLSYHINGLETPVLKLYRGVQYTFNVMAGDQHPLYLTSDITGGNSNAAEKIYAGGEASFGTAGAPHVLKWMPDGRTPAGLYYQCFVHQKLGWKVQVVDDTDTSTCSKTHPYVGFKGKLSELEHGVAGEVEVLDDCTFIVRGFKYDGQAPAVHFYGGKEDKSNAFKAGAPLGPRLTQAYDGKTDLTVRLPPSASWDTVGAISVWCEQFSANFGSLMLKAGTGGKGAAASCEVMTDTGKATYDSCVDLPGAAAGMRFFYSLSQGASGNAVVKGALATTALDGWVGLGFAQTPGVMVGANAVVMRQTPKGVEAGHYYLGARTVAGVTSPSKLPFKLASAAATTGAPTGRKLHAATAATATFEVELSTPYATALTQSLPFIYASGPTDPATGGLRPHTLSTAKATALVLGRKTAGGAAATSGGGATNVPRLRKVHSFLMGVGWGVLIPLGIVAAHSFKEYDPIWFYVHVACQVAGFALGAAGFGIGIYLGSETKGVVYKSHRIVGILAFALSILQVLLGMARPGKASRLRRGWELAHHWTGRTATLLAIINIYRGFDILNSLGTSTTGWKVALSVVLGVIVAVGLLKTWAGHLALPPPAETVAGGESKARLAVQKETSAGTGQMP